METKNAFYMVYVVNENTPTFTHKDLASAEAEAKRLCKKTNKKTYVLCSIKSFEINEFNVTDCRPDMEGLPF